MTANDILRSNFLDIVFENRNKDYGAYLLRKYYPQRLLLATLLCLLVTGTCLYFIAKISSNKTATVLSSPDGVIISSVTLPHPTVPLPPPVVLPAARSGSHVDRPFDIVQTVESTVASEASELSVATGPTGNTANDVPRIEGVPGPPLIAEVPSVTEVPTASPQLSSAPSFPGGPEAWASFLQKHLRAPLTGEPGERTTVLVRFIVSDEGFVTGFTVVQSGGALLDNEVIRVLRKMPKWKPAISNGKSIPAAFTQPVTFQVSEQ